MSSAPTSCLSAPSTPARGGSECREWRGSAGGKLNAVPAGARASWRAGERSPGRPRSWAARGHCAGRLRVPQPAARVPSPLRSRSPALTGRWESRARAGAGVRRRGCTAAGRRVRGCSKSSPSRQSPGSGISKNAKVLPPGRETSPSALTEVGSACSFAPGQRC